MLAAGILAAGALVTALGTTGGTGPADVGCAGATTGVGAG